MNSIDEFRDLTDKRYYNQSDYWDNVVTPILDRLGVPKGAQVRRREFPIITHWGERQADWLIFVGNKPILVIEAEQSERNFEKAKADAKTFASNFNPKRKEDKEFIREIRNIPYIFIPCGKIIRMFKLTVLEDGLTHGLEPIEGLLSYEGLETIARRSVEPTGAKPLERNLLATSQFRMNFEEICSFLRGQIKSKEFKGADPKDLVVLALNEILIATFQKKDRIKVYSNYKLPRKTIKKIERVLNWYDLTTVEGEDLAYAYREFVTQNFTGKGFGWKEKEVGRYLTPASIIDFMVKLVDIHPNDKVIDFACGSGGFLGAIVNKISNKTNIIEYLKKNLFACDVDLFSVSTAYTFMELLLPGEQLLASIKPERFYARSLKPGTQIEIDDEYPDLGLKKRLRLDFSSLEITGVLNIYRKNALFSQKIHDWELDLKKIIVNNSFDVVISNPPGGQSYNLGYEDKIKKFFPLEKAKKSLQNAPLFVQRAIQLAKNKGRICLVVPDGVLTNVQLKYLQDYIFSNCEVKAVVSLPRGIFPNVPSKMNILYMVKTKKPSKKAAIFMASVRTGFDSITRQTYDLDKELEAILTKYRLNDN